jgi:hypothetical protein
MSRELDQRRSQVEQTQQQLGKQQVQQHQTQQQPQQQPQQPKRIVLSDSAESSTSAGKEAAAGNRPSRLEQPSS